MTDHHQLLSILARSKDATAIYDSPELRIAFANDAMLSFWGKDRSVIGKTLEEAIPEIIGQPFTGLLKEGWRSGRTYIATDSPADFMQSGALVTAYFNFEYRPILDQNGKTTAILHTATDVTERLRTDRLLKEKDEREKALNEALIAGNKELSALNKEYLATNEELVSANDKLRDSEQKLQRLHDRLITSETLFRNIFEQATLGLSILSGPQLVIEQVNQAMLDIWGRSAGEVLHRPHRQARPELEGQPVFELLQGVLKTGKTCVNTELKIFLKDGDGLREAYVNSVYSPIKDKDGQTICILVIVDEVTDIITERKRRERLEAQFRLTIESADLATWYLETASGELLSETRVKTLFGFGPDEPMTLADALAQVRDDYRDKVAAAITNALQHGEGYEMEYPIIGKNDGDLRWVKAFGKVYPADVGGTSHFSGVLLDITQRKLDDQRRNDFIGIVSHELRAPLTSMKGYVQMLAMKTRKLEDVSLGEITGKAQRQIERMQTLITGFLDVARMGEGKIRLNLSHFDMADLVKLAEDESLATISTHEVVFHPVEHTPVEADQDKIEQVLVNLINNAVKYSPNGSIINVTCITRDGKALVSVADEGMGIAKEDQPHIFDRFYRVEADHTKRIKGFGIGLYISKEIIACHGGEIGVDSEPGKGSTFWFLLPVGAKHS